MMNHIFCSPEGELVSRGSGVGDGDLDGVRREVDGRSMTMTYS